MSCLLRLEVQAPSPLGTILGPAMGIGSVTELHAAWQQLKVHFVALGGGCCQCRCPSSGGAVWGEQCPARGSRGLAVARRRHLASSPAVQRLERGRIPVEQCVGGNSPYLTDLPMEERKLER